MGLGQVRAVTGGHGQWWEAEGRWGGSCCMMAGGGIPIPPWGKHHRVGLGDGVRGDGGSKKPDRRVPPHHSKARAWCSDLLGPWEPRTRAGDQRVRWWAGSVVGGRHLLPENTGSKAAL